MTMNDTLPAGVVPAPSAPAVARAVVRLAVAGNAILGIGAFWLSFTALADLAGRAGIDVSQAWAWPVIVDGMIVVATVSIYALTPHGWRATWFPWLLLFAATLISVAGNAVHAGLYGDAGMPLPVRVAIAAVPPAVQLAVTHLTVVLIRRSRPPTATPVQAASPDPTGIAAKAPGELTAATVGPRHEAARLRALGWSDRRIAHALTVHPSTVGRWLGRPGEATATPPDPDDPAPITERNPQ